MKLFFKSNKVVVIDDKITAILAQLRRDISNIYAQKKIDQIKDYDNIQNWNDFVEEIKIVFSNKSKITNTG